MPTVLTVFGFKVVIFTHDHEPKHVHISNSDGFAIINIEDCSVRKVVGMKKKDVARAREIVYEHREYLNSEWDRIGPIA